MFHSCRVCANRMQPRSSWQQTYLSETFRMLLTSAKYEQHVSRRHNCGGMQGFKLHHGTHRWSLRNMLLIFYGLTCKNLSLSSVSVKTFILRRYPITLRHAGSWMFVRNCCSNWFSISCMEFLTSETMFWKKNFPINTLDYYYEGEERSCTCSCIYCV